MLLEIGNLLSLLTPLLIPSHAFYNAPALNSKPKIPFTISGHVDTFPRPTHLHFIMTTVAHNKACHSKPTLDINTHGLAKQIDFYRPRLNKDGHYQLTVYLDKYRPGHCQWRPYLLSVNCCTYDPYLWGDVAVFYHGSHKRPALATPLRRRLHQVDMHYNRHFTITNIKTNTGLLDPLYSLDTQAKTFTFNVYKSK